MIAFVIKSNTKDFKYDILSAYRHFSRLGAESKYFGFVSHIQSVAIAQLCWDKSKQMICN